jgi:catechol 2,3-dioxygenase-like lactoylglutathione lyase family enzyme
LLIGLPKLWAQNLFKLNVNRANSTMQITGLEELIFGVDDVGACATYLTDYGLTPIAVTSAGGRFESLDGSAIVIAHKSDTNLPAPLGTSSMLRKTVYGVRDSAAIDAVATELERDRAVQRRADGSIESYDDMGFAIGFQVSRKRPLALAAEVVNAPGSTSQRAMNHTAVNDNAVITPRSLSHVVYFVPDAAKAEAFYTTRLGFRCTDRLLGAGPFLRPTGSSEHHCLFLIQTPPQMKGVEHFTFHVAGPTELMQAGTRFVNKGYESFWGPGRHKFGSNWFWYFNSPLACHVEYDADMDLHDDSWQARQAPMNADNSQLFLFQQRDKWAPGGPPPPGASH